jgi:ubiquinone/menaquinone biosynthesis C-methylase UbiE
VKKIADPSLQQQEKVNIYFQSQSGFWKDIYESNGIYAEIHRNRYATVLDWIDNLMLTADSKVLEIGCGAGLLSVVLAQRGLNVHAIDSVADMVEQARRHAMESGAAELLSVNLGNVYSLPFGNGTFDLVIAIGVIPWLERPELAIQEMARVTKSAGYLLLTADNRARLNVVIDPWLNPALVPLKHKVKDTLDRIGLRRKSISDIGATSHSRRFIDLTLNRFELVKTRSTTLGFGPFSLLHRSILPESLGIRFHYQLQRLADSNVPVFRSSGAHYIVLAKKLASQPCMLSPRAAQSNSKLQKYKDNDESMEVHG